MKVSIRRIVQSDVKICSQIIYEVFKSLANHYNLEPEFPSVDDATRLVSTNPLGFVADSDGKVIGVGLFGRKGPICGVGPVAVDPNFQGRGVGRQLMKTIIEANSDAVSIRLLTGTFNIVAIALYASLNFQAKEPLALMRGKPKSQPSTGIEVRELQREDLADCSALYKKVHGYELNPKVVPLFFVALREGCIRACAASAYWVGYGVAETEEDMKALLLGIPALIPNPLTICVPMRLASFFRWSLNEGLRIVTLQMHMVLGIYQDPKGCYLRSVVGY